MRWAAVSLSRGIGLPSAVDGTKEVEEVFDWKRGGKEKGSEWRLDLVLDTDEGRRCNVDEAEAGGGGG